MKRMTEKAVAIMVLAALAACGGGSGKGKDRPGPAVSERQASQDSAEVKFPFPEIPAMLTEPEERKRFLLVHYWEQFNFADSALVGNRNVTEQGLVNQLALLAGEIAARSLVEESLDHLCSGMERHEYSRKTFMKLFDEYLYDPNSPYYNEPLYQVFLKRMLDSKYLDEARKSSLQFKLNLISRNNRGEKATSFAYYLPDGSRRTLAQCEVENDRLLLVFYDPECASCHDVLMRMAADRALAQAVSAGKLTVLAIYTEGNEDVWLKTLADMPQGWIVGSDREAVKEGALYDLKAMPSLYLLDAKKTVLMKDASYDQIRRELMLE